MNAFCKGSKNYTTVSDHEKTSQHDKRKKNVKHLVYPREKSVCQVKESLYKDANLHLLNLPKMWCDFSFIIFHFFGGYHFFHEFLFCPTLPKYQNESLVQSGYCNHLFFFHCISFHFKELSLLVDFMSGKNYYYDSRFQQMHPLSEALESCQTLKQKGFVSFSKLLI